MTYFGERVDAKDGNIIWVVYSSPAGTCCHYPKRLPKKIPTVAASKQKNNDNFRF